MRPTILSIIGKPLAGKDTQADLLVAAHPEAVKISTGHIVREVQQTGETHRFWPLLGPYISMMEQGLKLPDGPILDMLEEVVAEQIREGKHFLVVAGSPRSFEQLDRFEEIAHNVGAKLVVVHIDAKDETTFDRSAKRNEGRVDDTPEVHAVRLEEYRAHVLPMALELKQTGRLVEINGEQSIPRVFAAMEQSLQKFRDPEITLPMQSRR